MQLKITRTQRTTVLGGAALFCLDARVLFTRSELTAVQRYNLGRQIIYNSDRSKRLLDKAEGQNDGSLRGGFSSLATLALASMSLNISVNSLAAGQHIECKSLDELLGAEEAIMQACSNLRGYIDTATTFDGRELLWDYKPGEREPELVATASPQPMLVQEPLLALPVAAPVAVPAGTAATKTEPKKKMDAFDRFILFGMVFIMAAVLSVVVYGSLTMPH